MIDKVHLLFCNNSKLNYEFVTCKMSKTLNIIYYSKKYLFSNPTILKLEGYSNIWKYL
jgi:hypothetical protein